MHLPRELTTLLVHRRFEPIETGKSEARVWRCARPGHPEWYLKVALLGHQSGLEREAACMRWLRERGWPVPTVVDYRRIDLIEYLVSEAGIGTPASDDHWSLAASDVATALGQGLARLHATEVSACPFDRRVRSQLEEARARIAAGLVREDDFDLPHLGRTAASLFDDLLGMIPVREELVLVHGDFCLPNVLLSTASDHVRITGLVDCARAGIGDRHQDLALAMRSLSCNLGPDTVAPFLAAYGHPSIDSKAIEFFTILDEFF